MVSCLRLLLPGLLLPGLLVLASGLGPASAEVAEPSSYWTGPMRGDVPETLAGAHVVRTKELAALLQTGKVVLVDAASPEHRPAELPPDALWIPPAHPVIEGSVWLPGLGAGALDDVASEFYRNELARLAEHSLDRAMVFYCHPKCWASWNAAKRAVSYGYRNVYWYPEGVEGWQDAGRPLAVALPRVPGRDKS
jgi:PQQ-dependent catabolism-associated CXXCW motif protein